MRIISGSLKGRTFRVPPKFPSRPTTDFAKEGLFNILSNSCDFEGMTVLDLCAGTGNLSFEFLSRGASNVTAVDGNPKVCAWLQKNALALKLDGQLSIVHSDCLLFLKRTALSFDLVIADPPFELAIHSTMVDIIFQQKVLNPKGLLIVEHGKRTALQNATNFDKTRNFGNVNFSFFKWP
ncbi:MAG: 16S rRNA (guanine(966)-N(2))-methyltransferase RsmD [Bacteroidetes bacterium]|nr:16S rRNA (guanine(966)-N(2))-methyltransferase RsmD [Bacteroidota bacterium]MBM3424475.1 16S rRNA (guanine(966)-N(2))-methyltransferase RsmD [Bacteroidota bacterium]